MRVAMAIPAFLPARDYGGPVQKILRLQPGLAALGVEVTVVTSTLASLGQATLPAGPDLVDNIPVLRLSTPVAYRFSPWVAWRNVPDFDVMHVMGAWNGLSYAALTLGRRAAGAMLWEPLGMLVARGRHAQLKRALGGAHSQLMKRCDGVIWTSQREQAEAAAKGRSRDFFRANPCEAVDMGDLPSRAQARAQLGLPEQGRLWGYLGRIDARKGIERLLRAWPGPRAGHLVIAGPAGDMGLTALVDNEGRGVQRHPALSAQARWLFLRALDALLLVPDFGENFGNVVVEAMQAGTPVVASAAVGCLDWIDDPGVRVVNGDADLRQVFTEGTLPPAPGGLPATFLARSVAAVQHNIYHQVLQQRAQERHT